MFETFKSFISDFVDGEKHPSQFAANDYRLAAAARKKEPHDGRQLAETLVEGLRFDRTHRRIQRRHDDEKRGPVSAVDQRFEGDRRQFGSG